MHKNSACNNIKMWTAETRIEENKEIQTTTQTKTVNKVTQKPVQLKFCILPKFHHQVQGKNRKLNFAMHCHTIIGFNVKSTETSWHNLKKGKKRKKKTKQIMYEETCKGKTKEILMCIQASYFYLFWFWKP